MGSMLTIAKKEFTDLLNNRMVLLVLIAFLIYVLSNIYTFYSVLNGWKPGAQPMFHENMGIAADNNVFFTLSFYGTIMGIIIGCSTVSSERIGKALSVLNVKPVYRDAIINGKVLGSLAFLASVILFYIAIFTIGFLLLCGNALAPFLLDYFSRLPFVFLFIMVYTTVFLSISLLISLLVRDQAFAMILSTLAVYISQIMYVDVSYNLGNILPGYGLDRLCISLSHEGTLWLQVQPKFMNTSLGAYDAFLSILPEFIRLLITIVITMALSYIVFVRRDIL
ncbi:ABC-type transport system involved in multi-copper enzyme maturation, permease component [Methanocella conradii HZ254]|uniref:ABC-type transport system involved in multi-copper enzyme maturation, permease component n=2 Tax=Methanocella TaxID=570266 RepID=H8I472_METCZ|nr:ABC-type transport system involved in multi-copper enzyme maturation, permease component [Methanocella conradii HZ254]